MFVSFFILNFLMFVFYAILWKIEKTNIDKTEKERKIYYPTFLFSIFPATMGIWINNIFSLNSVLLFITGILHINFILCIIIYFNILFLFYILTFKVQTKIIEDVSWNKITYIWATIIYIISGSVNPLLYIGFYIINKISVNFGVLEKFKIVNNFKQTIEKIEKRKNK